MEEREGLIRELSVAPYPDCLICFAPIHPAQPVWSCSPPMPVSAVSDDESGKDAARAVETAQCCWTTFHLKCIRSWASKSVKNIEDAWRARGEERKGEWRCPGCQSKRLVVPNGYWCVSWSWSNRSEGSYTSAGVSAGLRQIQNPLDSPHPIRVRRIALVHELVAMLVH